MARNNYFIRELNCLAMTFFACNVMSASVVVEKTTGQQSPVFDCKLNSTCTAIYNSRGDFRERIGKKLAIRSIYLIPVADFFRRICAHPCKDASYEVAYIYLEIQSIWPEPFLLTAGNVSLKAQVGGIELGPGQWGLGALSNQITANSKPSVFLFKPGEIKFISLAQGVRLGGAVDFFKGDVLNDPIYDKVTPVLAHNVARVADLNQFFRTKYGKNANFQIQLFEKDYQPALVTNVALGQGSDLFVKGDIANNHYQFKHDAFIGEALYQLGGGKVPFQIRWQKNLNEWNFEGAKPQAEPPP